MREIICCVTGVYWSKAVHEKKVLLPVGCEQQLRGGNEALIVYMKPKFKTVVKQKNR